MQVVIEDTVNVPDRKLRAGDKFKAVTKGHDRVAVYVAIRTEANKIVLIDLTFCNRNNDDENFDDTLIEDVIKERKKCTGEDLVYFEASTCTFS